MSTLGLVAGLLLAGVFTAAAVGKLADRTEARKAAGAFGVPERLAGLFSLALPLAELAVAALLFPGSTRAVGGAASLTLLGLFSGAIAVSLARGQAPDCHCFGRLSPAPVSRWTLVRNALLAGLAGIAFTAGLAGDSPSAIAWIGRLGRATLLGAGIGLGGLVLAAIGGRAFLSLLRSQGRVLLRLELLERRLVEAGIDIEGDVARPELGHAPGTVAPAFTAADATGAEVSLDDLLAPGLPLLLLFTGASCGPCEALLPRVATWQLEHADRLTIALASGGDADAVRAQAQEHGLERVLADHDLGLYGAYQANGTPSALLVSPDGTIASYVASGAEWIEDLVSDTLARNAGLPVGSPAPELTLAGLTGEAVSLAGFPGEETLVLFWNPGCGYCQAMRDELHDWERNAPAGAPRLLVVSSGDEASVQAEGFSSPVALDPDLVAGTAFEAGGTPMATLIDGEGRIASPLAVGADAVFALARAPGRAGVAT